MSVTDAHVCELTEALDRYDAQIEALQAGKRDLLRGYRDQLAECGLTKGAITAEIVALKARTALHRGHISRGAIEAAGRAPRDRGAASGSEAAADDFGLVGAPPAARRVNTTTVRPVLNTGEYSAEKIRRCGTAANSFHSVTRGRV